MSKAPKLFPYFILTFALANTAHAESLDFSASGDTKINGVRLETSKPADLYADVTQVIQGPEGITILYLRPTEARKKGPDGKEIKTAVSAQPKPFTPESSWKMFDAKGALTNDARYATRVVLPYPADITGALLEANWNECDGPINGNYVGLPCSTHRGLSDDYLAYLKTNYLSCINESLKASGLATAVSVHIEHDGTTADNQHNKFSLHSVGRAIDVRELTTTDASGKTNLFDFTQTNTDHQLSNHCAPAGTANCKFF
ncbi:MAG: hypothetical protein ACXWTJ_22775 [Bdellovibrionota bacterium]